MRRLTMVGCTGLLAVLACVSSQRASIPRQRDVITREELAAVSATTAWDAVANLRPAFLRSRGAASFNPAAKTEPTVFLENAQLGGPASLKQIPIGDVAEIRFIDGWETEAKFGPGFRTGVIHVLMRVH